MMLHVASILFKDQGTRILNFWHILVFANFQRIWEKIKFYHLMSLKILRGFSWKDEFVWERVRDYIIAKDVIHSRLPPTSTPEMLVHMREHFMSISGVGGSLEYFRKLLACHLRKFRPVAVAKDVRRWHARIDNIFIQIIADIRIHVHNLSENDNFHRLASVNTNMRVRQPRIYNIFGN